MGGSDAIVFSGYLEKLGGWIKNWKRRWFVLQRSQLTYYTDEAEAAQGPAFARGSLLVCGSSLRALEPSAASGKQFAIGLTQACSTRLYVFIAPNEQARIDWLTAFVKAGGGSSRGSVSMGSHGGGLLGGAATLSPLPERMFAASSHEGFLQKLGGLQKTSWQSRYFVLLSDQLLYFREPNFSETATDNDAPRGNISLRGATLHIEPRSVEVYGVPHVFSITPAEPQRSLMSSLLSKEPRAYVFYAKDYVDLSTWVTRLREKMEKSTETEENSDSDEEEQQLHSAAGSTATPAASASASPFVPPTGDVLSSVYKLDSSTIDGGGGLDTGGWKKRYAVLELKGKTLRLWKRKPSAEEPASKPKTVDLKFASLTVNPTLKCSKTKNIPVLTIGFPPAKDDAAGAYSSPFLHLAPSTQSRFDSWLSFLTLACGKKRRTPSAAAQPEAEIASAAESAAAPAPAGAKPSSRKASTADPESAAPAGKQQPRAKRRSGTDPISGTTAPTEKRSQSQLLADMSAALADDDAMTSFRTGCADLARGALKPSQFFKGYWRTFGKRLGRVFWAELVSIIPHEETQNELNELYEQHRHVLEAKSTEETEEAATEAATSSPDPSPSPVAPSMPSFHPRPANGHTVAAGANPAEAAMPSFVPPLPHEWAPVSPVSSNSDFSSPTSSQQQPASSSSPTAAQQRKGSAGPSSASSPSAPPPASPLTPPAAAESSSDDPTSRAHAMVSAWSLRCDHNILTLLCTLHEVLPSVVSVGQFIPFDDGYPGLKQVHSCYLKAVRVLHPDKTKHLSGAMQILGQAVFQTVQAAWEKYEKAEKKKASKEAKKEAAAAAAGEQPD